MAAKDIPDSDMPEGPTVPPVASQTQPSDSAQSSIPSSDHEIVRGSAAAVDPSTPAVATQGKKRSQSTLDRGKRG